MYLDAISIPHAHLVLGELTILDVSCSPISASAPVARFLSVIFPNLNEIFTIREHENNKSEQALAEHGKQIIYYHRWSEIMGLILGY